MTKIDLTKQGMWCCSRCAFVGLGYEGQVCGHCGGTVFELDPSTGITVAKWHEIIKPIKYGKKTLDECITDWYMLCQPYVEEVVMKNPEFNMDAYNNLPDWFENRKKKFQGNFFNYTYIGSLKLACPYCKCNNIYKNSLLNRMFSWLFGTGTTKKWHCKRCKNDF